MTGLAGAAVVPAAPLLLPAASPDQPAEIRGEVRRLRGLVRKVLTELPAADVHVLVAAGPRGIHDQAVASLAPLGVAGAEAELPVAEGVIEHLSRLTQYPMFRGDPLGLTHSVLVLLLRDVLGDVPVLPLNVPATTDFDALVSVGASIAEAVRDAGLTATVVAAGDLSAGLGEASPAYHIDGAGEWDAAVIAAVNAGDLTRLRRLGPEDAERVRALGWAPLAVLHGACAAGRLNLEPLGYAAPRGVGQLVARCRPESLRDGERFQIPDPRRGERGGVVPRTGDPRG